MSRAFPKIFSTLLPTALAAAAVWTMADAAPAQDVQAEAVQTEETTTTSEPVEETSWPGLWAFLDPETGELLDEPTPEQSLWLDTVGLSSLNKSSLGLETFGLSDGGRGVNLSGRFRSALVVHRRADGNFEIRCVDHPDQPLHHAQAHAPAAAPAEPTAALPAPQVR